jgi:hypothetical protein
MRIVNSAVLVTLGMTLAAKALPAQAAPLNPNPMVLSTTAELRLSAPSPLSQRGLFTGDVEFRRPSRRQGEVLMIVGGAGILVGLIADEALITIAGAAVGGYGLYVYLSASPKRRS